MFLLILLAPLLAAVVAPGLPTPEAAQMMIWLAPFVLPIALAAVLGGVLNVFECNRVYALAPVFLSVGVITTVWLGHDALGMLSRPLGFAGGGSAAGSGATAPLPSASCVPLPDAGYSGLSARHPGLFKQVRWVFCKAFLDKSVEISDRILASLLISGSMSALWFSQRLIQLPLAVIGPSGQSRHYTLSCRAARVGGACEVRNRDSPRCGRQPLAAHSSRSPHFCRPRGHCPLGL